MLNNIRCEVKDNVAEIDILGYIGEPWFPEDTGAKQVADFLNSANTDTIKINISSLGGDVFHGLTIYEMLSATKKKKIANIIGPSASAATIIAMGADEIHMADTAMFLIHNTHTMAAGNAEDLKKTADELEKFDEQLVNIYKKKTGKRENTIKNLMGEDKWISAEEAMEFGLVDKIYNSKKIAASAYEAINDSGKLPKVSEKLINQIKENEMKEEIKALTSLVSEKFEAIKNALTGKETKDEVSASVDRVKDEVMAKVEELKSIEAKVSEIEAKVATLETEKETLKNEVTVLTTENEQLKAGKIVTGANAGQLNPEGGSKAVEEKTIFDSYAKKFDKFKK